MRGSAAPSDGNGDLRKAEEQAPAGKPTTARPGRVAARYRIHWHILFTHFPISLFMVSAGFMVAHLFTHTSCFETSSYVTLVAGAAVMWPTTVTGWFTWKNKYKGAHTRIFLYKIWISVGMMVLSTILAVWHGAFPAEAHTFWHGLYFTGFMFLFLGSVAEGYFGGRLNHR